MKASSMASADTRIIPVKPENQARLVTKNIDGSMAIQYGNGKTGLLPVDESDMQAFVVWTMLNDQCTESPREAARRAQEAA